MPYRFTVQYKPIVLIGIQYTIVDYLSKQNRKQIRGKDVPNLQTFLICTYKCQINQAVIDMRASGLPTRKV